MKKLEIVTLVLTVLCIIKPLNVLGKEQDVLDLVLESEKSGKVAYITFDDGPTIYTDALLDVLKEYSVPAIFFVLGDSINYHPEAEQILDRMLNEGHFIGLHTMTHNKHALYRETLSPQRFVDEMLELREEVDALTGHLTNLCRAPYGKRGHFQPAHFYATKKAGLYCVDWHVDSQDWAKRNASQIYDEVVRNVEKLDGDASEIVLLFHEYERTATALPLVLDYLIEAGYRFEPYVEGKVFEGLE